MLTSGNGIRIPVHTYNCTLKNSKFSEAPRLEDHGRFFCRFWALHVLEGITGVWGLGKFAVSAIVNVRVLADSSPTFALRPHIHPVHARQN